MVFKNLEKNIKFPFFKDNNFKIFFIGLIFSYVLGKLCW